ncbi:MAG: anti-sigma factor antagonist [Sporomusaceae bacterium]|nr:anti-sigma factor antagonist [Sporomusaceae bacterium]
MKLSTHVRKEYLVIRAEGEFDVHAAAEFKQTVDNALTACGARNLALSFKGVSFIDSSGVGAILSRYKRIQQLGGEIAVMNLQPQVARVLELAGLFRLVKVYQSEKQAFEGE